MEKSLMSSFLLKTAAVASYIMILASGYYFMLPGDQKHVIRAVYYWKNNALFEKYMEDSLYKNFLTDHRISKVYFKMLDVDWNAMQGVIPISKTTMSAYSDGLYSLFPDTAILHGSRSSYEILPDSSGYHPRIIPNSPYRAVPVVFITNRAMTHINKTNEEEIALNILRHTLRLQQYTEHPVEEIQVDCDWTASTRDQYFSFLSRMKTIVKRYKISATIRLHQYKNYKTCGIPPVDRGMLMLYNMTNATRFSTRNSIFNTHDAVQYLPQRHNYALPLDVALPMFSWGLVFNIDNSFKTLFNDMNLETARKISFLKSTAPNIFSVQQDTFYRSQYLRAGDKIKIEQCYEDELRQATLLAKKVHTRDTFTIALFDLNLYDIKSISHESIEQVYNR